MNSHLLMASGFAAAMLATFSIRRYGHATIFLVALIETFAQVRYPFHVIVRDYLLRSNVDYSGKYDLQVKLLVGAGVGGAILLLLLSPVLARLSPGRQLMMLGSFMTIAVFGIELISLHRIDALIYQPLGSFALCAIVYFTGASIATGGALIEARRRPRPDLIA